MKLLKLKNKKTGEPFQLWKIEQLLEVCYIETCLQLYCDSIIRSCVNSGEPYYRYNHLYGQFKGITKALSTYVLNLPFSNSGLTGMKISVNPLIKLDIANQKYITSLTSTFVKKGTAYIKYESGGLFFSAMLDEYEVISETDVDGFDDVGKLTVQNFQDSIYFK